jgi:hypothetical protein
MFVAIPPVPFPCLRSCLHNKGPGRNKLSGKLIYLPKKLEDSNYSITRLKYGTVACETLMGKAAPAVSDLIGISSLNAAEIAGAPRIDYDCEISQLLCELSCDSACVPMLPSRGASHRASDSRSDASLL